MDIETRSVKVLVQPQDRYMRFLVTGEYDFGDFQALIRVARAECLRREFYRALFDISTVKGEMPDLDRFNLALQFAEEWGGRMRAAVLVDANQRVNKLFETAALNRSAQVQVGYDSRQLTDWLLDD